METIIIDLSVNFTIYDGKDDKIEKKCTECIRLGVKCMPPKNLRVPQRVDPDEAY